MPGQEGSTEWSRRHLLAVLISIMAVGLLLLGALAYTIAAMLGTHARGTATGTRLPRENWPITAAGVRGAHYRDAVAAKPMLEATAADLQPSAPTLNKPKRMIIGSSTSFGPANVPTGFSHTAEGAVGQLAAIEVAALTPMSVQYARDIHQAWAMRGGSFTTWEIAQAIQSFHASAGTVDGDGATSLTATPVGAQIKGTDGPDWVLACVQLDVTVRVAEQVQFGYGHCDRMQWNGGRWMIAPGTRPVQAPSTWPGSQRSLDAGWRLWVDAGNH